VYTFLNKKRLRAWETTSQERKVTIANATSRHQASVAYQRWLKEGKSSDEKKSIEFLEVSNPGVFSSEYKRSRTILMSDATGSMSSLWQNAKVYIRLMLTRIKEIGGIGCIELLWVAYRDYCDGDRLLEYSEWTEDPDILLQFIETVHTNGGGDGPEAVEIALEFANSQTDVTNVILIADAEPHMEGKGATCEYHKRTLHTDYLYESKQLGAKHIPIHGFYMGSGTELVKSFNEMASITGGSASALNDASKLIDVVCQNVLQDIGGEKLALEYRKAYLS